jgi:hypothetical protein
MLAPAEKTEPLAMKPAGFAWQVFVTPERTNISTFARMVSRKSYPSTGVILGSRVGNVAI